MADEEKVGDDAVTEPGKKVAAPPTSAPITLVARFDANFQSFFGGLRGLLQILMLVRFSILLGLGAGLVFLFVAQCQEVLRDLSERGGQTVLFTFAGLVCGGSAWYSARLMTRFQFHESDPPLAEVGPRWHEVYRLTRKWGPRLMGASVPLLLAVATLKASGFAQWPPYAFLVSAVVFLVLVSKRRAAFAKFTIEYDTEFRGYTSFRDHSAARRALRVALVVSLMALIVFSLDIGQSIAAAVGAGAVVLMSLACLTALGAGLVYFGQRYRVPVLILVFAAAVLFSPINDNHHVRKSAEDPAPSMLPDATLAAYYEQWIAKLETERPTGAIPVYIVATEGGGIRAAYWTGKVLGRLQDQNPSFARHVFAISGVSGGSLGGAVFAGLAKSGPRAEKMPAVTTANDGDHGVLEYERRAHDVLSVDSLSPTVAVMFFPDLVQRLLPFRALPDRAAALESSWERSWKKHEKTDLFAGPLHGLWDRPGNAEDEADDAFGVPLLFLNSTDVETGRRVIVNPICGTDFGGVFHDALNGKAVIGTQLRVSTAVHMSARFTYVSPAGTIHRDDADSAPAEAPWIRVVDGGYFENSGTVTAAEILHLLRAREIAKVEKGSASRVHFRVVLISNEPVVAPEDASPGTGRFVWAGEVLSPLRALLHVRPARGRQARAMLEKRVNGKNARGAADGGFFHFDLKKNPKVGLPLGWLLSRGAREEMRKQLDGRAEYVSTVLSGL